MQFSEVVGHSGIKRKLIHAVREHKVSHAQMILGPHGSGNFEMCLAYATYMFCEEPLAEDSCGQCVSCRQIAKNNHPDLHFSFPFFKIKEETVSDDFLDQWLPFLNQGKYLSFSRWKDHLGSGNKQVQILSHEAGSISKKLFLKSFKGGPKICIMWLPEQMRHETSNKLLKLIEEPPEGSVLLFASESTATILPTIMSRVQVTKLPRIADEDMKAALMLSNKLTEEVADSIVKFVEGDYCRGQEIVLTGGGDDSMIDDFALWMRACYGRDVPVILNWTDKTHAAGRDFAKQFLEFSIHMIRQCILGNYTEGKLSRMTSGEAAFASKFARFIHHGNVVKLVEEIEKAHLDITRNAYMKITLTDLSFKVNRLLKMDVTSSV